MYKNAIEILNILENNNYKGYIIGGFVRDRLLGIDSNDIDITTSAEPSDLKKLFNVLDENYGSLKIIYKDEKFEVTTFRIENEYINNRKPNNIEYTDDLLIDLKRRDFTINTICIDKNENYIDILNGIEDINCKKIKCVGNANEKLKQDSLRILRAIRFATILNFKIDNELSDAISKNIHLLKKLSYDRIKIELDYIFKSNNKNYGLKLLDYFNVDEVLNLGVFSNVIETDYYLGIYAQLNTDNFNLTKKEKKCIEIIRNIISYGKIDEYMFYLYEENLIKIASKILNIEYKKLDLNINNRSDIDISYEDLIKYKININDLYIVLEKNILLNKLQNRYNEIIKFLDEKYR